VGNSAPPRRPHPTHALEAHLSHRETRFFPSRKVDILNVEPTAEDKENNNVHAAAQDPEDVVSKVSFGPRMLQTAPYTLPLTR